METILPSSPLILREGTMLVQGIKDKGSSWGSKKEGKEGDIIGRGLATLLESVLTRRILQEMTTTIATTSKAMEIKGTTGPIIKERGMITLLKME